MEGSFSKRPPRKDTASWSSYVEGSFSNKLDHSVLTVGDYLGFSFGAKAGELGDFIAQCPPPEPPRNMNYNDPGAPQLPKPPEQDPLTKFSCFCAKQYDADWRSKYGPESSPQTVSDNCFTYAVEVFWSSSLFQFHGF